MEAYAASHPHNEYFGVLLFSVILDKLVDIMLESTTRFSADFLSTLFFSDVAADWLILRQSKIHLKM